MISAPLEGDRVSDLGLDVGVGRELGPRVDVSHLHVRMAGSKVSGRIGQARDAVGIEGAENLPSCRLCPSICISSQLALVALYPAGAAPTSTWNTMPCEPYVHMKKDEIFVWGSSGQEE